MSAKITKQKIIKAAMRGYADGSYACLTYKLANQHDQGDTLADFIVLELTDGLCGDEEDIQGHAVRLLETAIEDIRGALAEIERL